MTVPIEAKASTPEGRTGRRCRPLDRWRKPGRSRRVFVYASLGAFALVIMVLVRVVPSLAAPIGTAAGVIAVALPTAQRLSRVAGSDSNEDQSD
jgi:hypothetical protein